MYTNRYRNRIAERSNFNCSYQNVNTNDLPPDPLVYEPRTTDSCGRRRGQNQIIFRNPLTTFTKSVEFQGQTKFDSGTTTFINNPVTFQSGNVWFDTNSVVFNTNPVVFNANVNLPYGKLTGDILTNSIQLGYGGLTVNHLGFASQYGNNYLLFQTNAGSYYVEVLNAPAPNPTQYPIPTNNPTATPGATFPAATPNPPGPTPTLSQTSTPTRTPGPTGPTVTPSVTPSKTPNPTVTPPPPTKSGTPAPTMTPRPNPVTPTPGIALVNPNRVFSLTLKSTTIHSGVVQYKINSTGNWSTISNGSISIVGSQMTTDYTVYMKVITLSQLSTCYEWKQNGILRSTPSKQQFNVEFSVPVSTAYNSNVEIVFGSCGP